jgi:hypothetical protein
VGPAELREPLELWARLEPPEARAPAALPESPAAAAPATPVQPPAPLEMTGDSAPAEMALMEAAAVEVPGRVPPEAADPRPGEAPQALLDEFFQRRGQR